MNHYMIHLLRHIVLQNDLILARLPQTSGNEIDAVLAKIKESTSKMQTILDETPAAS